MKTEWYSPAKLSLTKRRVRSSIRRTFRKESPETLLWTFALSYFSIIISFTGLYYTMSAMWDLADAHDTYEFYHQQAQALDDGKIEQVHRRIENTRAFRGITPRLWGGPDQNFSEKLSPGLIEPPTEWVAAAARHPESEVILFDPGARLEVLIACLHMSVATTTTLGYGDIAPNRPLVQLSTDLQVLSSVLLTVVGLGMLFGGWLSKD